MKKLFLFIITIASFLSIEAQTAATLQTTTGTFTVPMTANVLTITPTGACTFNAVGGVVGERCTFIIITSGTSAFVLTWGTNFKSTATLSTGILTAKRFSVTFICVDGTTWQEVARTSAM